MSSKHGDHLPKTVVQTKEICEFITAQGFTPKEFMVTFLSSTDPDLVSRRRLMKAGTGVPQTRSILRNLGKLTSSTAKGKGEWEDLILEEALEIVNQQEIPRLGYPEGGYVSWNKISPDFFSDSAEQHRENQIKTGMKFLHGIIYGKIAFATKHLRKSTHEDQDDDSLGVPPGHEAPLANSVLGSTLVEGPVDDATIMSLENLVCVKDGGADPASHRLAKVPTMLCAMIATVCNRRANAIPLANGLMAFAGGVSCRINEWLHAYGVVTSRPNVLMTMDHLRILQEQRMMDVFKVNHKLLPLLVYDNVDIHLRIHNTRIETSSRLFHGTWGFYIVVRACLQAKCAEEAVNLGSFLNAMASADRKPVKISSFLPTPAELRHWVLVVKAQLAKALKEYAEYIPGAPEAKNIPLLTTKPPPIDPIEMHQPNIHFLRMMDAPDSSAEGVSRVLDEIIRQIGVEPDTYAESLLVAGGDVGSNQLLESLRVKRFPPVDAFEGLEWVLSIFGGAHTTWNFTKSVLALHWGNTDIGEDSGVWRAVFALGGDHKKPVASQDFNTIMRSAQMVHKANLVFIISQVIKSHPDLDLTKEGGCNQLLELVWKGYFDADALEEAGKRSDLTHYNFLLRLRDFASVVEAHDSTRTGDIGRLMLVWKRWAVMAQGVQGLSHYARHIPRMVLLLEEDLPKSLAHAIKHSVLIPSSGRDGHWMTIDEFLEVHIFWLKSHYNNTGHGTDLDRLIYRLSNNIPLLRKLMQLLKIHSGNKIIYQPNIIVITGPSMQAFLSYATNHLSNTSNHRSPAPVTNAWRVGVRNMIKLIRADTAAGQSSRYRWGAANVLSSWENDDDAPEED